MAKTTLTRLLNPEITKLLSPWNAPTPRVFSNASAADWKTASTVIDRCLSNEQKAQVVWGNEYDWDDGAEADIIVLLGGDLEVWNDRLDAAFACYQQGRARKILVTGAVQRRTDRGMEAEAVALSRRLQERGVPEADIIIDAEARTTQENMIYSALKIYRTLSWDWARRIIVVTSRSHMRRSLELARIFLPGFTRVVGAASTNPKEFAPECFRQPFYAGRMTAETVLLWQLAASGQIADITLDV